MAHNLLRRSGFASSLLLSAMYFCVAPAQIDFQFSGYVVDIPIYQRQSAAPMQLFQTQQDQILNLTRLRLRPNLLLWDGARLTMEHETASLYTNAATLLNQSVSTPRRQVTQMRWTPITGPKFTLSHFVDRLYFRQNFASGSFVLGRQRISWGTGRVWNPTDLFNPINPASFDKIEKDGADAVSFKYYFGQFTDIEVVHNPEMEFKRYNAGIRFRTNYGEYDMSLMLGTFDRRIVAGGDFAGNLLDAGVRGEGIFSADRENRSDRYVKLILGIDRQFSSKIYGMVEYHFNGEGAARKIQYDLHRLARGEIINLGRHYLASTATYQLHPLVFGSASVLANLGDGSGYFAPAFTYSSSNNTELSLGGLLTFGKETSEYWYYPLSVYVKGSWFF